jgi:hypothetical protein
LVDEDVVTYAVAPGKTVVLLMVNDQLLDPVPSHPEEMRATFDLRFGTSVALQGSARMTPAGMVTIGVAVAAILLGVAAVVRASR